MRQLMRHRAVRIGIAAGLGVGLVACAAAPPAPSLYRRLGGRDAIRLVVDDFVANVVADARIRGRFAGLQPAAVERLKTHLADQICEAAGGPCSYLGRDMKTAHRGLNISEVEWTATVEALVKALDKHRVGAREKGEVLALLAPMKADIVGQ
jgi:hemoglobin